MVKGPLPFFVKGPLLLQRKQKKLQHSPLLLQKTPHNKKNTIQSTTSTENTLEKECTMPSGPSPPSL
jgi:hypothetical protein